MKTPLVKESNIRTVQIRKILGFGVFMHISSLYSSICCSFEWLFLFIQNFSKYQEILRVTTQFFIEMRKIECKINFFIYGEK
jgi:hypothetical protein